jgi:hypothetical protein
MEEYGFRDVGEVCGTCRKQFGEEEDLYSALSRQEGGYERLDFCDACWEARREGDVFCFWKRKPRTKETQPTVDGNVVFDIFQRLEGSADRHDQNFRYILALLLMRRKRLKFLDVERTEHGEFLVLLDRQLEDVKYRLLDPGMTEEEMQRAKDEVDKLFSVNVDEEDSQEEKKEEGAEREAAKDEGGEKGREHEGTSDGQGVSEVHQS